MAGGVNEYYTKLVDSGMSMKEAQAQTKQAVSSGTITSNPNRIAMSGTAKKTNTPTKQIGNGGINYNTANHTQKKAIEQNESRLKNDQGFVKSEVQRATDMINQRKQAGMDTSAQEKYLSRISNMLQPEQPQEVQPNVTQQDKPAMDMSDLQGMVRDNSDSYYKTQEAMAKNTLDTQITNLEKAYQNAVIEGTLSQREAQEQFEQQKEVINQQAYLDSQRTNLEAESRGIANSQQMMGMMASDNSRKNSLINQNMTTRDKRVSDIKDRIRGLSLQKDLDTNLAQNQYNNSLMGARGQADLTAGQQMFDLGLSDYDRTMRQNFEREMQQRGFTHQSGMQQAGFGHDMNMEGVRFNNQFSLQDDQQEHQVGMQENQQAHQSGMQQAGFNHDEKMAGVQLANQLQIIDANGNWDLAKIAKQNAGRLSAISAQAKADIGKLNKQAEMRQKDIETEYNFAVKNELAKHTPGTPEYKIAKAQLDAKKSQALDELATSAMFEADMRILSELPTTKPSANYTKDVTTNWNPFTGSSKTKTVTNEKAKKQYEADLDAYNRGQAILRKYGMTDY